MSAASTYRTVKDGFRRMVDLAKTPLKGEGLIVPLVGAELAAGSGLTIDASDENTLIISRGDGDDLSQKDARAIPSILHEIRHELDKKRLRERISQLEHELADAQEREDATTKRLIDMSSVGAASRGLDPSAAKAAQHPTADPIPVNTNVRGSTMTLGELRSQVMCGDARVPEGEELSVSVTFTRRGR